MSRRTLRAVRTNDAGLRGMRPELMSAGATAIAARPADVTSLDDVRRRAHARGWRLFAKRALDIVGAAVGLVVSAPIMLLVVPAIRFESRGRIIFAQTRIGRHGETFRCYKLRTMCDDAEQQLLADRTLSDAYHDHGFKVPAHADHRITALGRFLRTTSLDEVPQFWNVLRGDMSLVGPRPIVPREIAHYAGHRNALLSVRPGLTGAWAVSGRSRVGYPQRAMIELDYVRRWSIRRDLAILAKTVLVVLQRRGAY